MKNESFIQDNHALSEVIGALLIMAILISTSVIYLSIQIPIWNERAEFDHMNVVYEDMTNLKSDIYNVEMYETPKSCTIHLGATYPGRTIFRRLGSSGASGNLEVNDNLPIVIEYTDAVDTYSKSYNSSTITYTLQGTSDTPTFIYEHGVIIKEFGTANLTRDKQTLISTDDIYIPIVQGTSGSTSSTESESFTIYPCTDVGILNKLEYVTITLDTNYPEVWRKLLEDVNTTDTQAYVSAANKIVITTNATQMMVLPTMTGSYSGIYVGVAQLCTYQCGGLDTGVASGIGEYYLNKQVPFWTNIPPSDTISEFTITDIGFKKAHDAKLQFEVFDWDEDATKWKCELQFDDKPGPDIYIEKIKMEISGGSKYEKDNLNLIYDPAVGIDLLNLPLQYPSMPEPAKYTAANYPNAGVGEVNLLQIKKLDKGMYYVRFKIG